MAQDPAVANPPTLLLPLSAMARGVAEAEAKLAHRSAGGGKASSPPSSSSSKTARLAALAAVDPQAAADAALLEAAYPRVKRWVEWLLETQAGGEGSGVEWQQAATSFRWRGRDASAAAGRELNPKTLASGLDDYPRASHPDEHEERHVDLLCWAALAARLLATVAAGIGGGRGAGKAAEALSASADAARFSALAASLGSLPNLRKHHWDAGRPRLLRLGVPHRQFGARMEVRARRGDGLPGRQGVCPRSEKEDEGRQARRDRRGNRDEIDGIDELDEAALAVPPRFVSHVGYVSLFPFSCAFCPAAPPRSWAPRWTRSKSSSTHSRGSRRCRGFPASTRRGTRSTTLPYWRGAVWPPVNYLALAALDFYAEGRGRRG